MDDLIRFRTRYTLEKWSGTASRFVSGRSSEASEIRVWLPDDDARDIVWSRSTGSALITRNRLIRTSIDICFIDDSSIIDPKKKSYIEQIRNLIEKSCHFSGDTFHILSEKDSRNQAKSLKKKLIFIPMSTVEIEDYKKYIQSFSGNDIIFLSIYHPVEIVPTSKIIFDSHFLRAKYYKEMKNRRETNNKILHSLGVSNIELILSDNILLKLNHFFKYRYG